MNKTWGKILGATIFHQCKINDQSFLMGDFWKLCQALSDKSLFAYGRTLDNPSRCLFISLKGGRNHKLAIITSFNNDFHLFSCFKVNISSGRCTRVWGQQQGTIYCCCHVHLHWRMWAPCFNKLLNKFLSRRLNIIRAIIILFFNIHRWLWWTYCTTSQGSTVPRTQCGNIICQ